MRGFASAQTVKPGWQAEWDKIREAAKKEGKVVASIPPTPELRKLMEIAFTRRYGIATEFVPARGGAVVQRMVSEAKAGMQYFDLHIGGTESVITAMLPENILDAIDPYLILPEVREPKHWWGGHIYIDNAKRYIYNFVAYQTVSLWSDPNQYKPSEVQILRRSLEPETAKQDRYQRSAYAGFRLVDVVLHALHQRRGVSAKTRRRKNFLSPAICACWRRILARGKIAVTSGIGYSEFQPFIKADLPVTPLPVPKEGVYVSGGYGHLTILEKQPSSQRHQSFRQLAAQPRRPRSIWPRHGRGQPPAGGRYQVAQRLWRHRGQRFSDAGPVLQVRKSIGRKDQQDARTRGGVRAQAAWYRGRIGDRKLFQWPDSKIYAIGSTIWKNAAI